MCSYVSQYESRSHTLYHFEILSTKVDSRIFRNNGHQIFQKSNRLTRFTRFTRFEQVYPFGTLNRCTRFTNKNKPRTMEISTIINKYNETVVAIKSAKKRQSTVCQLMVDHYCPVAIGDTIVIGHCPPELEDIGWRAEQVFSHDGKTMEITNITASPAHSWLGLQWTFKINGRILKKDGTPSKHNTNFVISFPLPSGGSSELYDLIQRLRSVKFTDGIYRKTTEI